MLFTKRLILIFLVVAYGAIGYCEVVTSDGDRIESLSSNLRAPIIRSLGRNAQSAQKIELSADGAIIYYTTDNSDPLVPESCGGMATDNTHQYEAPILLATTTTVKAIACNKGGSDSPSSSKPFKKLKIRRLFRKLPTSEAIRAL